MKTAEKVKIEKWAVAVMLILGALFYFIPGEWISMQGDSLPYLEERGRQGILPGYPAFLDFFRSLMGEESFLNGVVIAQSLLAIACTFLFVLILQKQFRLKGWECILLYLATMLPFSIYLPESGITHQIMTEGITYALFYLYFITVLKTVWTLKIRWYAGSVLMAYILGLIRSQMLFLQAIGLLLLIWIVFRRCQGSFFKKTLLLGMTAVAGVVIAFGSYKLIYATVAFDNARILEKAQESDTAEVKGSTILVTEAENTETFYISQVTEEKVPEQFDSVIVTRGFFEADREDVVLFEDEMMQQIFLKTYELANENECLHHHLKSGLYMWEDLVHDQMPAFVDQAVIAFDEANPGVRTRSYASIVRELGLRVMFRHFGRFLYHGIRLMMPSFIATVFFQIRPIYLLCHFVALFIYLFAILGSAWAGKHQGERSIIEFVMTTVLTMVVMVVILNLVFIGLQRYVVYGMGIFYCSMYLLIKEIYLIARGKRKAESVG